MKQESQFSSDEQHRHESGQESHHQTAREFATAEELLRFDAAQTVVPPPIAERLKQSAAQLAPPPRRAWWQKLFGR
jgi:hypothetical protein